MPNKPNNAAVIEKCTQRLNALETYVQPGRQIAVNGVRRSAKQVRAIYQDCIDGRAELARRRAAVKEAMALCAKQEEARLEADRALKAWAVHEFGVTSQQALDFGFPPAKVPTMTVEQKKESVRRAKATREARHTMGKRQREKIRGVVPEHGSGELGGVSPPDPVT
jgi:hypothetical protein